MFKLIRKEQGVKAYSMARNLYIEVVVDRDEHHMTNRAHANTMARDMGYVVRCYLGKVYYRNSEGYPTVARQYAIVKP